MCWYEISSMMLDYYSFNNKRIETGEFALSDEAFDLLSDTGNVEARVYLGKRERAVLTNFLMT